jgi:hypothetical protein
MVAHAASYRILGTGALPRLEQPCAVKDELDVADLESEASHAYELFGGTSATNLVVEHDGAADGGRSERARERFVIALVPGGRLVTRVSARDEVALESFIEPEQGGAATSLGRRELWNGEWQEVAWTIPPNSPAGRATIELRVLGGTVTVLHHWSLAACAVP